MTFDFHPPTALGNTVTFPFKFMPTPLSDSLLTKSSLYQEFLAEREEVLRHKWLKSEEAKHDIGFESALVDWMLNHRSVWKKERAKKNKVKTK